MGDYFHLLMRSVMNIGFGINIAANIVVTLTCDGKSVDLHLQYS